VTATTLHTWAQRGTGAAEASGAALTMWAADGHRLTLTQNGGPVLLARPSADWFDLHVLALGTYQSPIPPIRTTVARSIADGGPMARGSWVHDALTASPLGPLRAGHWCLTYSDNAPPLSRRPTVAWDFSDTPPFIPLGGGAAPDRVAAYRRFMACPMWPANGRQLRSRNATPAMAVRPARVHRCAGDSPQRTLRREPTRPRRCDASARSRPRCRR
jgi:hypothetical protein